MRAFILLCIVAVVSGEHWNDHGLGHLVDNLLHGSHMGVDHNTDKIHDYSFVYHSNEELLLIRNSTACFLVHVDSTLATKLDHTDTKEQLEDDLYMQIKNNKGWTLTDMDEISQGYHDNAAVFACYGHDIYTLKYMSV